ncbi:hypothetical protein ACFFHT_10580 [Gallibacterium melopsittaci]|uniref:Uncharacterized protein n=1 Tax=Gallibacterium melopsittaci TaxID=516063 RepID=A0ABV6HYL8_9PAST
MLNVNAIQNAIESASSKVVIPHDVNTLDLIKNFVACSIASTITVNGHRTRKTCGFFVPQIHTIGRLTLSKAEFVARSIRRTKASNRTNKASRLTAVVEALLHLLRLANHLLITVKRILTMKTIQHVKDGKPSIFPIAFTSTMAEVNND